MKRFSILPNPIDWFQNLSKLRKILLIAFIPLFICGILLFFMGSKSAELKTLESSASIIQLQTGQEVRRFLRDNGTGLLGKPEYAEVLIVYEPVEHYTTKDVYDEIVTILEKNNWEGEECNTCTYIHFSASLQQGDFTLLARVLIRSDENLVNISIVTRNP
jgi:hypothetical protein